MSVSVVVLAGGTSRRFGGDKLAATLDDRPVLDVLLDGLPAGWPVVCVGPERVTVRDVVWTREEPPGGGPLAAVAAGLAHTHTEVVVVLAGDQPFAAEAVEALVRGLSLDAVTVAGNPLLAAYRTEALRRALPADPAGKAARTLLAVLAHTFVAVPERAGLDVDTPEQLVEARRRLDR